MVREMISAVKVAISRSTSTVAPCVRLAHRSALSATASMMIGVNNGKRDT